MLICDNAIREAGSNKISLIGIFARIATGVFPAVHPSLCVYANLGDAEGQYRFRLELVHSDSMMVIGRGEATGDLPDRMEPSEIIFEMKRLLFDKPGNYEFVLYANNDSVGRKSFKVVKLAGEPA